MNIYFSTGDLIYIKNKSNDEFHFCFVYKNENNDINLIYMNDNNIIIDNLDNVFKKNNNNIYTIYYKKLMSKINTYSILEDILFFITKNNLNIEPIDWLKAELNTAYGNNILKIKDKNFWNNILIAYICFKLNLLAKINFNELYDHKFFENKKFLNYNYWIKDIFLI